MIEKHLTLGTHNLAEATWTFANGPTDGSVKLAAVRVCKPGGPVSYDQFCGLPITLEMDFWCLRQMAVTPSFHLYNQNGVLVFPTAPLHLPDMAERLYAPGLHRCRCVIPAPLLNSGTYSVHVYLSRATDGHAYVTLPDVVSFHVINDGTGQGIFTGGDWPGVIRLTLPWSTEQIGGLPSS
jgi:hypothetical protein